MKTRTIPFLTIILLVTFVSHVHLQESNSGDNRCLTSYIHGNCSCCKSGFRGQTCNHICKHCLSRLGTEQSCTYYCKTGYYGKTCDKPCPTACAPGISGPNLCKERYGSPVCVECISGYYGKQCDQICDTNCLNRTCYQTDGKCLNCSSNEFYGDHCRLPCSQGCISGTCNRTGHCTDGCKIGFYSKRCTYQCGSGCIHGNCTSHRNHAYNCTEGCHSGYWGTPCLKKCPNHCTECEQQSGGCTLCMENYVQKLGNGECVKVKEGKPAVADGSNLVMIGIILVVVIIVIITSGIIILVIWKKRRHRHRALVDRSAEEHLLSSLKNDQGDEHKLKFISLLSSPQERHGECVSPEKLEVKIKDAERVFVKTNGYKKAKETLQQHGYVTITGGVGEGKTTMALMLGVEYRQQGYDIVMVEDVGSFNYHILLQATYPCFIILDDVFGLLDLMTEVFDLEKLINFFELLTELVLGNTKKYVVALTSQTHKLKEGLERVRSETTSQFFREKVRVCLGDGVASLTLDEKLSIFDKHKQNHGTYLNHYIRKSNRKSTCGFPLICRMLFAFEQSMTQKHNVFTDPLDFLKTYITDLISGKTSKSAACIVMVLYEDKLNLPKLEIDTNDERFESIFEYAKSIILGLTRTDICVAARSLRGTLFTEGDVIGFAHPVIYDACAIALARLNIALVLKNCSLKFICERVRESVNETSGPSNDSHTIQISKAYHEIFVQRLMKGIENGQYAYVAKHPLLKLGPVEMLLVEGLLRKVEMSNSERGDAGINDDVVNMLKLSVHGHISSLYEGLFKTNITFLPATVHTLMNECSICGNCDALDFILRRFEAHITDHMICEALLLAVQNRHNNISQCLMLHASKIKNTGVTGRVLKYFEAEEVPPEVFYYISIQQMLKLTGLGSVLKLTAQSGKDRVFMMLLELNKLFQEDINGISEDGNNMLHLACEGGSREIVEHFLPTFDVNSRGQNGRTPLMTAVYKGAKDIADLLMTKGADHKLTDNYGETVLGLACRGGNTSIVEDLLPSFDINSAGENGWTPVMIAAFNAKKEVFDLLVTKGADLTLTSNYRDSVLHLACRGGNTLIVEHLLPLFDINSQGENGWTPVMNAASNGKKEVFDLLVTKEADLTRTDNYGNTGFHLACRGGNTFIVERLLPLFDISGRGQNGWTPVMNATYNGKKEVFDLLVTKRADLSLSDDYGNNLHHLACLGGNTSIVEQLLPLFDINSAGENGWAPVMIAASSGKKEIFDLLVTKGADLTLTSNYGNTVLHLACRGGNTLIVEHLLPSFNINSPGENGWTPLMNAAYSGKMQVFDLLETKGADINLTDSLGYNILHRACTGGNFDIVRCMLQLYDVNVKGWNSHTPLMMAVCGGHIEVVDFLLSNKADVNLVDDDGDSLLHIASEVGNLAMVKHVFPFSDINLKDKLGLTPLMLAITNGKLKVFQYLVDKGASLDLVDNVGDGVLTLAYRGGCKEIILQLTPCGEEIHTIEKWTKLMYHVVFGHWTVLKKTQQDSPELLQRDGFGDTLLHLACRGGNLQCVEYLLPSYDINVRGRYDWTPVMMAARCGHLDVLQCLLSHKADLSLVSDTGEDILSLARRGTHTDIETFLLTLPDFKDTG